jgi:hypothetical protein
MAEQYTYSEDHTTAQFRFIPALDSKKSALSGGF